MKQLKKLCSVMMAAALTLTMATSSFAASFVPPKTVDVIFDSGISLFSSAVTHTYAGYKLMDLSTSLKCDTTHEHISTCYNYAYTPNIKYTDIMVAATHAVGIKYVTSTGHKQDATAATLVAALSNATHDQSIQFAEEVYKDIKAANLTADAAEQSDIAFNGLQPGYWLFVDTTQNLGNEARSLYLLDTKITDDNNQIIITPKRGVPEVDKKVSDNALTNFGDETDVSIGDTVFFKISGTLPKEFAHYETYTYAFHDTLSTGLKYNDDAKVYVYKDGNVNSPLQANKVDITAGFSISYDEETGKLTVSDNDAKPEFDAADLLEYDSVTGEIKSKIVLEYSAELMPNAVIGGEGNPNEVYLEYSNDPYTEGTGNTEEDVVKVYTFRLDVTKEDGNNSNVKLEGAEFVLYRKVNGVNQYVKLEDKTINGTPYSDVVSEWTTDESSGSVLTSDAYGNFYITGLDEGQYWLKETKAPDGYNLLQTPIEFTISAEYTDAGAEQKVGTLEITIPDGDANTNDTADGNVDTGVVTATVKNFSGAVLPETGGMGTTLFYAIGGVLVVGAVVLLVTKKRMGEQG